MIKTCPLVAVVDDEESIRRALTRLMRSAGLNVATFGSGGEFLKSIDAERPDCVVLDLHMPQMSGFAVEAYLAKNHPAVPVIVLTGHDSSNDRERAIERGTAAFLRKPVDDRVLLEAISTAVASANGNNPLSDAS